MYSFTPSTRLLDTHRSSAQALAEKNIDEVIISAVNDAAVMGAWAKAQDIDDNDKRFSERYVARQDHKVTMLADARCELAKVLDLVLDHPNNLHDLGGPRMKRFAVRLGVESHASRRVYSIVTGRCPHRRSTTTACSNPSASPRARRARTASTATPPATTRRSRRSPRTS